MESWEHNLALESEESSGQVGANLVLAGDSSGGSGPNLVIGIQPSGLTGRKLFRFNHREALPPSLFEGRVVRRGKGRIVAQSKTFRQHYRVADSSLDRYELFLAEGQLPDFDASDQPVATSPTLPFSYVPTPPDSGDTKELWVVVRKRNQYDLLSFNLHPTIIVIDSLGDEDLGSLSAPAILRVLDGSSGEIVVFARYPYGVDRNEADTWELYAEDGIDPDPDSDTPLATASFGAPSGDYLWRASATGLTPGNTYHVMIVVRRSSESGNGEEGRSAVTQHTLAQTFDMDEGTAWLFGGSDHEVGQ